MSNIKTVGNRIKESREDIDLTQEKLAEMVNQRRDTVAKWESGSRTPSIYDICALASALGVSTDYLLLGGRHENQTVAVELGLSDNAINRLKLFKENGEVIPLDFYSRIICEWYSFYTLAQLIAGAKKIQEESAYIKLTVESLNRSDNPVANAFACQLEKDTLKLNRLEAYEYARTLIDYLIDGGCKPHGKA